MGLGWGRVDLCWLTRLSGVESAGGDRKPYCGSHCFQIRRPVLVIQRRFSAQEERYLALVSIGTLQHFRPVRGPLLTSKEEEVLHGLSCLSTCTLIRLGDIDSIKVSTESRHAKALVIRALISFHGEFFSNVLE
jgi:hypothetical protein